MNTTNTFLPALLQGREKLAGMVASPATIVWLFQPIMPVAIFCMYARTCVCQYVAPTFCSLITVSHLCTEKMSILTRTRPSPVSSILGESAYYYTGFSKASEILQKCQRLRFNHSNNPNNIFKTFVFNSFSTLQLGHIQPVNRYVCHDVVCHS